MRVRRFGAALATAAVLVGIGLLAGGGASIASQASTSGEAATAAKPRPIHRAKLTKTIRVAKRKASIPGVIVGIWRHGKEPYVKTLGVRNRANGKPMTRRLQMRIASTTKSFTVTAILQLVDKGKIGLNDPIGKYISGVPRGHEITIRQLAAMRSGLFPYTAKLVPEGIARHAHRQWTTKQLLDISFRHPVKFEPGTEFDYSNTNTILLGRVVQKVSGVQIQRYINRHIVRPEGLNHTFFPRGKRFPWPHARGYTNWTPHGFDKNPNALNATNWNPSSGAAAGGMISRLSDLRKWARTLATGKLLKPATQRQREKFLPAPDEGKGAKYGLGVENNHGWIGHNGNIPGYITYPYYLPAQRTTMVVLINTNGAVIGSFEMIQKITRIISPNHPWPLAPD